LSFRWLGIWSGSVVASASRKGGVSIEGLLSTTVHSAPRSSHRRHCRCRESRCRFVASVASARDGIHESTLVFLKTGRNRYFRAKPGGVENRSGLTEHVSGAGRYVTPGGPTPV
jgi:hypothetical protein